MTIREARRSDLRAMAEVSAAAFMDEELFGDLMHPHRKEYPEDFVLFFERKYWSHWYDPAHHFLVGLDRVSGKVVGVAQWERQGASVTSPSWGNYVNLGMDDARSGSFTMEVSVQNYVNLLLSFFVVSLTSRVVSFYSQASSYIWPNRAADPKQANILEETFPFFCNLWSGSRERNWYLDMLATHPDFQGQGIGKELVKWGVEKADEEHVCASVISASGKEGFYGKFGFIERGRANVGPMGEAGILGGAVMFRDVDTAEEATVAREQRA